MARKFLDLLFWLAASLYFGGMMALALVAPAVFYATRTAHIELPGIPPSLDAASQAGGEIFGVILQRFGYVEIGALIALFIAIAGWMMILRPVSRGTRAIAALWLLVAAIAIYDAALLAPRVWEVRRQVRATAAAHVSDAKDNLWPERLEFDALHKRSEMLGHIKAYALLAMVAIAAWRGTNPGRGKLRGSGRPRI